MTPVDIIITRKVMFMDKYNIEPNTVLMNPKTHKWFKEEYQIPAGVSEVDGMRVIIVSSQEDVEVCLR